MFDGVHYAVQFESGEFYTGSTFNVAGSGLSERIEDARLYRLDWEIPKDLYLMIFLNGKNLKYKVVRVKVVKTFEILEG